MVKTIIRTTATIALPALIELMVATVLMPHLARRGFDIVVVITALSCAVHKRANACAFERHQHTNVCAFVLGQGRRDDGAKGVIVGNSTATAPTTPKATLMLSFVKLNILLN
jgi:hypothetical protein